MYSVQHFDKEDNHFQGMNILVGNPSQILTATDKCTQFIVLLWDTLDTWRFWVIPIFQNILTL